MNNYKAKHERTNDYNIVQQINITFIITNNRCAAFRFSENMSSTNLFFTYVYEHAYNYHTKCSAGSRFQFMNTFSDPYPLNLIFSKS